MGDPSLYSIGHGIRSQDEFVELLKTYRINYLVDVRSMPYSRYNPQFNQRFLKFLLPQHNIRYVFMGEELGGRPKEAWCYNEHGKIDYEKVKTRESFQKGIARLKAAYYKNVGAAIMCSESKPCDCHRTHLIGQALRSENIILTHIDEKGKPVDHLTLLKE